MAADRQNSEGENQFKYLGFFLNAAEKTRVRLSSIYEYAKENSGPLKEGVNAVEGSVKVVVGPLYRKIEGKPYHLLQFLDKKVDNVVVKVDSYVPPTLKTRTCQLYRAAKKAPEVARSVVADVRKVGVMEKAKDVGKTVYVMSEPAAKNLYNKYEPVAERMSLLAWYRLCQLPMVPTMVEALLPPSAYCIEKYNSGIKYLADAEYQLAAYLPLVPAEKIKNSVYKGLGREKCMGSEKSETVPYEDQLDESIVD